MAKDKDSYNKTVHIVVNQSIIDRIEKIKNEDDRSFSWVARKAIEIGLKELEKDQEEAN